MNVAGYALRPPRGPKDAMWVAAGRYSEIVIVAKKEHDS